MEILEFLKNLKKCTVEYRKLLRECGGNDDDIAHFFNKDLKRFIEKNKAAFDILSTMSVEKDFIRFVTGEFYKGKITTNRDMRLI